MVGSRTQCTWFRRSTRCVFLATGALGVALSLWACEDDQAGHCHPNWETTPLDIVAPPLDPVYYTRPYFTTCKEGAFHSSPWMSYDEPITEFDPEGENRVPCRSGMCRDGMCEDDLAYIEGKLELNDQMEPGYFNMESEDCEICNPNNALYSVWHTDIVPPPNTICDGGSLCCDSWLPNNGPCEIEGTDWTVNVRNADGTRYFYMSAHARLYGNYCDAAKGGTCVTGTTTLQKIRWANDDCSEIGMGSFSDGDTLYIIKKATIWMGNRKDFWDAIHGETTCEKDGESRLHSMSYFTCSGAAIFQTMDDHWFKAVWIHRYDPSRCDDKPCWMAARERLPVELVLKELPGDPGLD